MSRMDEFSKEELQKIVNECNSMRELARKCGYYSIGNNNQTIKRKLTEYGISIKHFTGLAKGKIVRTDENIFCSNLTATQAILRRHYEKKFPQKECAICGQPTIWNNKPLQLTLDHINGNNHDNQLDNLRWVCPNCGRQLPTFAGRNSAKYQIELNEQIGFQPKKIIPKTAICKTCGKSIGGYTKTQQCPDCYCLTKRVTDRPTREQLKDMIRSKSFIIIAENFGVTDNAIRKWCDQYRLPRKKSDIKKYSDDEWVEI